MHTYTDGGGCHTRCWPAHQGQRGVQYLAKRHFDLPITRRWPVFVKFKHIRKRFFHLPFSFSKEAKTTECKDFVIVEVNLSFAISFDLTEWEKTKCASNTLMETQPLTLSEVQEYCFLRVQGSIRVWFWIKSANLLPIQFSILGASEQRAIQRRHFQVQGVPVGIRQFRAAGRVL